MTHSYYANVTKIEEMENLYFIKFYDVEGAITFAEHDKIEQTAKECLTTMLSWLQQDGEPIPPVSNYDDVIRKMSEGYLIRITVDKLINLPFCA
jgi:predicted RNase H-like HicB family nuclease